MKNFTFYILVAITMISCGGEDPNVDELIASGDTEAIAQRKTELLNQKKELETEITAIEKYMDQNAVKKAGALVSITTVDDTLFNHYIELQGSVDTKQNITLTPEIAGVLTQVYVKEGQRVTKGQRLARIDDGGMSNQVEQMKVQVDLAETTFQRQKRLWDQNIGSEIQYLQAKTSYESQRSALRSMQQQLAKTIVTAPFSGVIDDVITEQGNTVSPGATPLMRLVNLSDMYIEVEVPETYIASIEEGTDVKIEFPVLGTTMDSKVRQTSSYINPANRSFRIEVPVPNDQKNIKPNLTARLQINDYTKENAILVPLAVISENADGEQYVMVATEMKDDENYKKAIAQKKLVTTGKTSDNMIEIIDGLKTGDVILVEGARSVKEGQEIRIKK